MKKIFTILFVLISAVCLGQLNIDQRQVTGLTTRLDSISKLTDTFNVERYGARTYNTWSQNTTAFTNCMAALIANGSGVFFLPNRGVYLGKVTVPSVTGANWLTIKIKGGGFTCSYFWNRWHIYSVK